MSSPKTLAIIPARGGSKRVPFKNTRELGGKPLIAWTIEAALKSECIDEVYVSTEDPIIEEVAHTYGCAVLHRPESLAGDHITTGQVVAHAVEALEADGDKFDKVVILHPTSPFRTTEHIDEAIRLYEDGGRKYLASVEMLPEKQHWNVGTVEDARTYGPVFKSCSGAYAILNAAIYIVDCEEIKISMSHVGSPTTAYVMDHKSSIDIDDELDFKLAEMICKSGQD